MYLRSSIFPLSSQLINFPFIFITIDWNKGLLSRPLSLRLEQSNTSWNMFTPINKKRECHSSCTYTSKKCPVRTANWWACMWLSIFGISRHWISPVFLYGCYITFCFKTNNHLASIVNESQPWEYGWAFWSVLKPRNYRAPARLKEKVEKDIFSITSSAIKFRPFYLKITFHN